MVEYTGEQVCYKKPTKFVKKKSLLSSVLFTFSFKLWSVLGFGKLELAIVALTSL